MNFFIDIILLYMERGGRVNVKKLVEKAKQGDQEALIELIMDKKQEYYKLAYVYMKNEEDALDAMEDMILKSRISIGIKKLKESFGGEEF